MNYDLTIILSSALFWIYIDSVKLVSNERVINSAFIHACISGIGNSVGLVMYPMIVYDYSQIAENVPPFISTIALISFGYSFYDLYIGVQTKKMDILHGFIFVSSYITAYYYNVLSMPSITMITEISSIFLNFRPYKKKWIDIAFVLTFFIYIILSPTFLVICIMNSNNSFSLRLIVLFETVLLVPLNVYWFSLIMKKMLNKKNEI
jgi:hypothetical protein